MATWSSIRARFGLEGVSVPSSTRVSNQVRVGLADDSVLLTGATTGYSVRLTPAGALGIFSVALDTGLATVTAGSGSVLDGDGKDWEGNTIDVSLVMGVAIYAESTAGVDVEVTNSGGGLPAGELLSTKGVLLWVNPGGVDATDATLTVRCTGMLSGTVDVVVFGS